MTKTNAMRLLEQNHINYDTTEYEYDENNLSGIHAAEAIGLPPEQVFNLLQTVIKQVYLFFAYLFI